jgi:hypothetical protein
MYPRRLSRGNLPPPAPNNLQLFSSLIFANDLRPSPPNLVPSYSISSTVVPCVLFTEYTELQPLLSGVHLVMRVKLDLAGEAWGVHARSPPLITFTITSKVAVYAPAEWADTLTLFHL